MTTDEIMQAALSLSGLDKIPGDCGIVVPGENIRRILAGVDMETAEIILGKRLGYDLVLSHHPVTGPMQAYFYKASDYLGELLERAGAPANAASARADWLTRLQEGKNHPVNYGKSADTARLLNMPYMGIHNIADAIGGKVLQAFLDKKLSGRPGATLKDVCSALMEVPEYQKALTKPEDRRRPGGRPLWPRVRHLRRRPLLRQGVFPRRRRHHDMYAPFRRLPRAL